MSAGSIDMRCSCGAVMSYVGNDIYGKSHAERFTREHADCKPQSLEPVVEIRSPRPVPKIAGWRR